MVENPENAPKNLTERRFREYWAKTEGGNERQRFIAIQKLIAADLALRAANRPKIGKPLIEKFGDGKWHSLKVMAEALGVDEDEGHTSTPETQQC
jgi:hypothetical protein